MPFNRKCTDDTRLRDCSTNRVHTVAGLAGLINERHGRGDGLTLARKLASQLALGEKRSLFDVIYERISEARAAKTVPHDDRLDALEARVAQLELHAKACACAPPPSRATPDE